MSKLRQWLEEKKIAIPDSPPDVEKLKVLIDGSAWPHDRLCMCDGCGIRAREFAVHLLILLDGGEANEFYQSRPFRGDFEESGISERNSVQALRQDSLRELSDVRRGGDRRGLPGSRDGRSSDDFTSEDS